MSLAETLKVMLEQLLQKVLAPLVHELLSWGLPALGQCVLCPDT